MRTLIILFALFVAIIRIIYALNYDLANPQRKDYGDIHTTEAGCVIKGCCWRVTTGATNCFHPASGDHVTQSSNHT
jgi:hypothetical protein